MRAHTSLTDVHSRYAVRWPRPIYSFIRLLVFANFNSLWKPSLSDHSVSLYLVEHRGFILLWQLTLVCLCLLTLAGRGCPRELVRQAIIQEVQDQLCSNKQFQWWGPYRSLTRTKSRISPYFSLILEFVVVIPIKMMWEKKSLIWAWVVYPFGSNRVYNEKSSHFGGDILSITELSSIFPINLWSAV